MSNVATKGNKDKYKITIIACFIGYVVQAIINNFAPLLFLTFQRTYHIGLGQITMLITLNFGVQLLVDLVAAGFVDKIGYRASMLIAHVVAAVGLFSMTILPEVFSNPYAGLIISIILYAIGGGLLEVLVSPIVESCPTDNKEAAMSLLHSFYCWGHVAVVLISTLFFRFVGIQNWKIMTYIWMLVPIVNALLFIKAPIASLIEDGQKGMSLKELFKCKLFWVFMLMMVCAGASEQAVSQWASTFAEMGLGVSKSIGDLAGPMSFAILMGSSRAFYGKFGEKIDLDKFMIGSSILCAASYLMISLSPWPVLSLVGCSVCGLSVGIMWPGTFSKAAAGLKTGGTAMFAFLALAGDLGCGGGPTVIGQISSMMGDDLKKGILFGLCFPVMLIVGIVMCRGMNKTK